MSQLCQAFLVLLRSTNFESLSLISLLHPLVLFLLTTRLLWFRLINKLNLYNIYFGKPSRYCVYTWRCLFFSVGMCFPDIHNFTFASKTVVWIPNLHFLKFTTFWSCRVLIWNVMRKSEIFSWAGNRSNLFQTYIYPHHPHHQPFVLYVPTK